jgi:hypothetical protein
MSESTTASADTSKYQGKSLTVHDIALASALKAVGVLQKKPATIVAYGSVRVPHFMFSTDDGDAVTTEKHILMAAKEPLRFIAENPQHPLAFSLAAVITYMSMRAAVNNGRALVGLHPPGNRRSITWLVEGSRKHAAALKRGLVPMSVDVQPSPIEEAAKLIH